MRFIRQRDKGRRSEEKEREKKHFIKTRKKREKERF